jgi:hypothetical protein
MLHDVERDLLGKKRKAPSARNFNSHDGLRIKRSESACSINVLTVGARESFVLPVKFRDRMCEAPPVQPIR